VITVPEDPADAAPDTPAGLDADASGSAKPSDGARITGTIVSHISDQARRTTEAAKARRVVNTDDGEPGVLDLTPLRELLAELMDELSKLRLRDRVANALRQAADIIESRAPDS
jgi:hypothetical protein